MMEEQGPADVRILKQSFVKTCQYVPFFESNDGIAIEFCS